MGRMNTEVYERRAWRLALLLTGDPRAAQEVARRSLDRQADWGRLPPARLDRLVVQAARQGGPIKTKTSLSAALRSKLDSVRMGHRLTREGFAVSGEPVEAEWADSPFSLEGKDVIAALQALPTQQREAWIFRTLDLVDPIEASKALDCSRTALDRHLSLAKESMETKLDERTDECIEAIRRDVDTLDPSPFLEWRQAIRRRRRRWKAAAILGGAIAIGAVAVTLWLKFV